METRTLEERVDGVNGWAFYIVLSGAWRIGNGAVLSVGDASGPGIGFRDGGVPPGCGSMRALL